MKEATIINQFHQIWKAMQSISQGFKLSVLSQGVRDQALENILVAKGVFTREELEAAVKEEAQKMVQAQTGLVSSSGEPVPLATPESSTTSEPLSEPLVEAVPTTPTA